GSGEDHDRSIAGRELGRKGTEVRPGLEGALLSAGRRWVVHPKLGRVGVGHPPDHRPREHLPKRLGRVAPVAGREGDSPRRDLLPRSSPTGRSRKTATALASSQRSFSIVTGSTSCCAREAFTSSASGTGPA